MVIPRAWRCPSGKFYTNLMASKQRKRKLQQAIGARIKDLRQSAGLTQEQLSEKAGIAPHYLSRLENAHQVPSLDTMIDLADALGTEPYVLLAEPHEDTQADLISRVAAMWAVCPGRMLHSWNCSLRVGLSA